MDDEMIQTFFGGHRFMINGFIIFDHLCNRHIPFMSIGTFMFQQRVKIQTSSISTNLAVFNE